MQAESQSLTDIGAARAIFASIGSATTEIAAFAYLDRSHQVIAMRQCTTGRCGQVDLPLRKIAQEAFALRAAGLVMAHNHPSADPRPSVADIAVTRSAARAFGLLDLRLVDHLIVTDNGVTSFRALGLL
jgi:DNA repair protein RadC